MSISTYIPIIIKYVVKLINVTCCYNIICNAVPQGNNIMYTLFEKYFCHICYSSLVSLVKSLT